MLAAGHCLALVDRHLLAVAAPDVARALRLGDGMLGFVLGTGLALAYAVAAVPLGRLADRGWRGRLLVGGVVLWSAASLATGLCASAPALIAARMAMGLGQAAFVPAALATLVATAEGRAARLALFTAGGTMGRGFALLGGGLVLAGVAALGAGHAWRWLFVVTAIPNILLIAALLLRGDLGPSPAPVVAKPAAIDVQPLILGAYMIAAASAFVVAQAMASWFPSLLARTQGLGTAQAGQLVGVVALVTGPAGQLLGGWLASRWRPMRRYPAAVVAGGLWAALPALALVTGAAGQGAAAVGMAGMNVLVGLSAYTALLGWQQLVPGTARGMGNGGFMAIITLVGVGAGPLLAGVLSQWGGGGQALGNALLLTALGSAVVASAAAAILQGLASRRAGPAVA